MPALIAKCGALLRYSSPITDDGRDEAQRAIVDVLVGVTQVAEHAASRSCTPHDSPRIARFARATSSAHDFTR
jgi:hypothetical protein